jgi:F-type H+-transporting ATPase subunit delta
MPSRSKAAAQLARKFFKLSLSDQAVSPERVTGVLDYIEAHRPANPVMVLRAYHRLIALELARSSAVVEHAGPITDTILQSIAGLRVHLADDVYEASASGRLEVFAESV